MFLLLLYIHSISLVHLQNLVRFSKLYRRDKKNSGLFAFCYIFIRFRLKAYFKFIKPVQVIHWQNFMFLSYRDTFLKNVRDFVTKCICQFSKLKTSCVLIKSIKK